MKSFKVLQLQKMLLAFCEHIITHKEQINSINVFPVPDQDTGSNLAGTFSEVKKVLDGKTFKSFASLTESVEKTALFAAQGNSGIIFTGFLAGFFQPLKEVKEVDIHYLQVAFESGAAKAWRSIEHPTKGTILDVIDAANRGLKKNQSEELEEAVYVGLLESKEALEKTQQEMKVLKESQVVDAGGLAFVMMMESFYTSLSGKKVGFAQENKVAKLSQSASSITKNRYEVVVILENAILEPDAIKEMIVPFGDSIDIVDISQTIKLHIHTDKPEMVKELALSLGTVVFLQLADMKEEKILELVDNRSL